MTAFRQLAPTDHFLAHAAYLPVYEWLFAGIREQAGAVLELGTNEAGGLLMYADYFKLARVVGVDVEPAPEILAQHPRITHHQRDAYTAACIEALKSSGPFMLIVDDGPHSLESQMFFVAKYPQLLAPGGLMIIEDVQKPEHLRWLAAVLPDGMVSMAIDLRHVAPESYDDVLFVCWRGS